jgi:hypothetical protein
MVNVPSAIQFLPILPNIKLRISVTAFAHKVPVKILGIFGAAVWGWLKSEKEPAS